MSIDYSFIYPAVTLTGYSFRISPGGEPQLWVEGVTLVGSPANALNFYLIGGIGGVQYRMKVITMLGDTESRTDMMDINLLGGDCGCGSPRITIPYSSDVVSSDGSIVINEAPRFFVSGTPPTNANVLDRWYNTADGVVYDFISDGPATRWVVSASGGSGGSGRVNLVKILPIHPDGVTTTFVLTTADSSTVNVVGSIDLFVSVDGVWQEGAVQYTAVGNAITFTQAPTADAAIFILWFAPVVGGP